MTFGCPKIRSLQTGFEPDTYFTAQGYRTGEAQATVAIVCVPRAKAEARAMMSQARDAQAIVVDGQKTAIGVEFAAPQGLRSLGSDCVRVFCPKRTANWLWCTPAPQLAQWAAQPTKKLTAFSTLPGRLLRMGLTVARCCTRRFRRSCPRALPIWVQAGVSEPCSSGAPRCQVA